MIETKYSTKEICQIFNFGRETLRHYERYHQVNRILYFTKKIIPGVIYLHQELSALRKFIHQ